MELMPTIVRLFPFFASNLKKLIFMTSSGPFLFERKVTFDRNCGATSMGNYKFGIKRVDKSQISTVN